MNRGTKRSWREVFAIAGLLSSLTTAAQGPAAPAPSVPSGLIEQGFVYSYPLYVMGALRLAQLGDNGKLNQWRHARVLAGAAARQVATPNSDTLYSIAWLDLAQGPVRLSVPETGGRYYSLALLDAFTNNNAILGRRTTGTLAAQFLIVGPEWTGVLPEGERVVRANTNDVLLLLRILVDGEADLPAVHELQDRFALAPVGAQVPRPLWNRPIPAGSSVAEKYVSIINDMLARNPPPSYEQALVASFARVGLCGEACTWDILHPELRSAWADQMPQMLASLRHYNLPGAGKVNGWGYSKSDLGNFGTDYAYRAHIALVAPLALDPVEAVYPSVGVDQRREALDGRNRYRVRIPAEGLPVDGFWSLSMYRPEADGRLFFFANPINRYAIGDRSAGLARNADGSLDFCIQGQTPTDTCRSNWLPAPPGKFVLILRAYLPRPVLFEGRYRLPAVERLD